MLSHVDLLRSRHPLYVAKAGRLQLGATLAVPRALGPRSDTGQSLRLGFWSPSAARRWGCLRRDEAKSAANRNNNVRQKLLADSKGELLPNRSCFLKKLHLLNSVIRKENNKMCCNSSSPDANIDSCYSNVMVLKIQTRNGSASGSRLHLLGVWDS